MTSRNFPFAQADAFTDKPLEGNPCAILFDTESLSSSEMQAIAKEMNYSETSFVSRSDQADFRFRFYTPVEEIPLAGHPCIATVHALIERGDIPKDATKIRVELTAGVIDVYIRQTASSPLISMEQLPPRFLRAYEPEEVLPSFMLSKEDLLSDVPIQTVDTGTPMLMVPLRTMDALRTLQLQPDILAAFRKTSDFFCAHLFCLEGFTSEGDVAARDFSVPPDVVEDPFTGSATGAMGCYLWRYNLVEKTTLVAQQGHLMGRPGQGIIQLFPEEPPRFCRVRVGGTAKTVLRGTLTL